MAYFLRFADEELNTSPEKDVRLSKTLLGATHPTSMCMRPNPSKTYQAYTYIPGIYIKKLFIVNLKHSTMEAHPNYFGAPMPPQGMIRT